MMVVDRKRETTTMVVRGRVVKIEEKLFQP
jgi:hypothetical protein